MNQRDHSPTESSSASDPTASSISSSSAGPNADTLQALLDAPPPADTQANRAWFGQYAIAAMLVADRLMVFDRMPERSWVSFADLASQLSVSEPALARMCRVLHCRELLEVDLTRSAVRSTAQSRTYWRRDSPLFCGYQFEEVRPGQEPGALPFYQERITRMLTHGWDPARTEQASFSDMWERGSVEAEAAAEYNQFMRTQSFSVAIAAVRSGVFAGVRQFVDLGGGSACFALMVKAAQPDTRCYILDLPEICTAASDYLQRFPPLQVELFPASFFGDVWPEGTDCFNLCNILHDWSEPRCARILRQACNHLQVGGTLVISEILLNDDLLGPEPAVVFDMLMHMNHRAQQFSFSQLARLLERAGFVDLKRVAQCGYYSILTARKSASTMPDPTR